MRQFHWNRPCARMETKRFTLFAECSMSEEIPDLVADRSEFII